MTDAPEKLSEEEREGIRKWCAREFPTLFHQLPRLWYECRDWHLSRGVQCADWAATFRNWVRKAHMFSGQAKVKRDLPAALRKDSDDLRPLADILPLFKERA